MLSCKYICSGGVIIAGRTAAYIPADRLDEIRERLSARDQLITDLLRATGYRLDDIMWARVWQLRAQPVALRERKTGKLRTVQLPEALHLQLGAAFASRSAMAYAWRALRAGGRRKQHRTTYWRHFVAAVRACGYADCGYTPHSLRKVYAVEAFRRTHSLRAVQADLGHAYIGTTAIYALSSLDTGDSCR